MSFYVECKQFDIKHEEDPLSITEIKTEQDIKCEIKTEAEECENFFEHLDIKHEMECVSHDIASDESIRKVVDTQESLEENDNTIPFVWNNIEVDESNVVPEPNQIYGTDLQEEKYGVFVFDCTREKANTCITSKNLYFAQNNHNTGAQNTDKLFKCNICSRSFSNISNITRHMSVHTGENRYTCNICSSSFSQKILLIKHIRTHTKERPFPCNFCTKSFNNKFNHALHVRIHTNERPFKCNVCLKSFHHKSDLAKHTRIHTNEKPFTCNICSKSFSQKSYLTRHSQTHIKK